MGALGANSADVIGSARVDASDNHFINITFGVMVEAAFPVVNRKNRGDVSLTLRGNTIAGSCQNGLLVSFTRHSTGLGASSGAIFQTAKYLRHSTFTLDLGGDVAWSDTWYVHPGGFGNTLVVDGQLVPNGIRVAYDAAKECPSAE